MKVEASLGVQRRCFSLKTLLLIDERMNRNGLSSQPWPYSENRLTGPVNWPSR